MLSLLTVAALSPEEADVRIIDEQVTEIPFGEYFDIVGITFMTAAAPRAYEIASVFRKQKIPVVFGGFHTTLNPDEAMEHADAIVVGSAFGAWEELIADFRAGGLQRVYTGNTHGSIPSSLPRDLVNKSNYITMNATYATLGCENRCHFCSISAFHKGQRRHRNVHEVVNEIASFRENFFMLVDDNLTQDREYVRELLSRLAPLKKKWVTQASLDIADDNDLLKQLHEAGCIGVFVGFETFNGYALQEQEKLCNAPTRYREAVDNFHQHGIFVEAGIMFGFDTDNTSVFRSTLDMLDRIGIDAIQVSILTPLPGTPLYDQMIKRIVDNDWEHYDYRHVVFAPRLMNADQLQTGADWVIRTFYSPWSIMKRSFRWLTMPGSMRHIIYPLGLNIAYFGRVKSFHIRGYAPPRSKAGRVRKGGQETQKAYI